MPKPKHSALPQIALPTILDIAPYKPGISRIEGIANPIKLSSNENPFGPSKMAIKAVEKTLGKMHRYPEGSAKILREAIAEKHGLDAARVVCGLGSDDIISLLCQAYSGVGTEVIYTEHGFLMYPISALRVGAVPVKASEKNLTTNVDTILKKVTKKTRLVFIANPNNPTGTYIGKAELIRLRKHLPPEVVLVIDGAYAEYVTAKDYTNGIELVHESENTAVTFTFSKIYGLANLRVGWGYMPLKMANILNRIRAPFNVSEAAQVGAIAALEDEVHTTQSRNHNTKWRKWLAEEITNMGLTVVPSAANFVLVEFPREKRRSAESADSFLQTRGIIGRAVKSYGLPHHMRFTIGLEEEVRALVEALQDFMQR